jgi:hypothetical protein
VAGGAPGPAWRSSGLRGRAVDGPAPGGKELRAEQRTRRRGGAPGVGGQAGSSFDLDRAERKREGGRRLRGPDTWSPGSGRKGGCVFHPHLTVILSRG